MKNDLKRLLNFFLLFKNHWLSYCVSTAMVSCRNLFITWLTAYISSRIVAVVTDGGQFDPVQELSLFLILLVLFVLFDCVGIYAQSVSIQRISNLLRKRLYHSFLFASIPDMERNTQRSELIARTNKDVDTAGNLLSGGIVVLLMVAVSGVGATVMIGKENIWICVFLYALGFSGLFLQNILAKHMRVEQSRMQKNSTEALSVYIQTVSMSSDIRMAKLLNTVHRAFTKCMNTFRTHSRRFGAAAGTSAGIDAFIRFTGFLGTVALCLYQYANYRMTLADVVLVSQMAQLIVNMVLTVSSSITSIHSSLVGIDRIFEMLNLPVEDQSGNAFQETVHDDTPFVQVRNAACIFGDGTSAFTDMNLEIPSGCTVALEGGSGSGKTTLMRILLKIYPYSRGSIRLFGQEIRDCSAASIRNQVGYIPQENLIFSGTVKDNLLIGNKNPAIRDEEIHGVIKGVGMDSWISDLPQGLDTPVSEGGTNLSGGQRQMLSIARALLNKHSILIMDEAFDGIDSGHILRIVDYIRKSDYPKSAIIITHDRQVSGLCDCVMTLGE